MFCMECGAEISSEAKFCEKCGASQTIVESTTITNGSNVGYEVLDAPPAISPNVFQNAPVQKASEPASINPAGNSEVVASSVRSDWSMKKSLLYGVIALVVIVGIVGIINKNSGHSLRTIVEDNEKSNWIISGYDQSISNLKASKSDSSITISFDMDTSKATSMFGRPSNPFGDQLYKIGVGPKLLVRLFDKNGQYLTHFSSAEEFTLSPYWAQNIGRSYRYTHEGGTLILLKDKGNSITYEVNQRDLRDAEAVAISFMDFKI